MAGARGLPLGPAERCAAAEGAHAGGGGRGPAEVGPAAHRAQPGGGVGDALRGGPGRVRPRRRPRAPHAGRQRHALVGQSLLCEENTPQPDQSIRRIKPEYSSTRRNRRGEPLRTDRHTSEPRSAAVRVGGPPETNPANHVGVPAEYSSSRPITSAYPQNTPRPDQSRRRTRRIFLARVLVLLFASLRVRSLREIAFRRRTLSVKPFVSRFGILPPFWYFTAVL
eukprot:1179340-Prorocentrum_minimum.AAC.5